MKSLNFISLFILASVASSCSIDPLESSDGVLIDVRIEISFRSEEGVDLLNPDNLDSYGVPDIGFYYMEDDQLIEFPNSRVDIFETEKYGYILGAGPGTTSQEFSVVYIQLKSDLDTMRSQVVFKNGGSYEVVHKVWYNGELVWDIAVDDDIRHFTIIKQLEEDE